MAKRKTEKIFEQRDFVMVYHDFLESKLLTANEKLIFIILKRFVDSKKQCFPSVKKIMDISGLSEKTIRRVLKSLEEKHIITIETRSKNNGGQTSNRYTMYDYRGLWKVDSGYDATKMIDALEKQRMIDILSSEYYIVKKEKGLESEPVKAQNQAPKIKQYTNLENNTTDSKESQHLERYSLEEIKQLFSYEIMIHDDPLSQHDIDSVMDILDTAMNTKKSTIRIAGEDKPTMVVIGKLMKLHKESILYAIDKFKGQTERIKNPTAYMLTVLFNAPEQYRLDIENMVSHDLANCSTDMEE